MKALDPTDPASGRNIRVSVTTTSCTSLLQPQCIENWFLTDLYCMVCGECAVWQWQVPGEELSFYLCQLCGAEWDLGYRPVSCDPDGHSKYEKEHRRRLEAFALAHPRSTRNQNEH